MTSVTPRNPASAYSDIDQMRRRVRELVAVADALRFNIDDPKVLSELTVIQAQLVKAREELAATRQRQRNTNA